MSPLEGSVFSDSSSVEALTLPRLPPVIFKGASAHSLNVTWTAPADASIQRHAVSLITI